jgi:hypothetical protein
VTAPAAYARRFRRTRLAAPGREREVFTVARARGGKPAVSGPAVVLAAALAEAWLLALCAP